MLYVCKYLTALFKKVACALSNTVCTFFMATLQNYVLLHYLVCYVLLTYSYTNMTATNLVTASDRCTYGSLILK